MRFYLCDTVVPYYARTLADVPAGASYEPVEVPVDHKGLTGFINSLIARVAATPPSSATQAPEQVEEGTSAPVHASPAPVTPKKVETGKPYVERSLDQTACEQHIHDIRDEEAFRLDRLQECIDNRRAEIARKAAAVQPVAPRKRVRPA